MVYSGLLKLKLNHRNVHRGESEESIVCMQRSMALKPKADVNRTQKHWYQWPHKKD